MSQESITIEVTPVGNGVYRLFSTFDKESVALTAQGLVELAKWIEANRETLVTEAKHEAAQRPAGANMLLSGR